MELRLATDDPLLEELTQEAQRRGVELQQHIYDLLRGRYLLRRGESLSSRRIVLNHTFFFLTAGPFMQVELCFLTALIVISFVSSVFQVFFSPGDTCDQGRYDIHRQPVAAGGTASTQEPCVWPLALVISVRTLGGCERTHSHNAITQAVMLPADELHTLGSRRRQLQF